jgi:hypothetical protein
VDATIGTMPSSPPPARRSVLRGALLLGVGLSATTGCEDIRVGRPETYSPPPEGIDDLYRKDLLDLLQIARSTRPAAPKEASEDAASLFTALHDALGTQHAAMLTGAEASDRASRAASSSASPSSAEQGDEPATCACTAPDATDDATDPQSLAALLVRLRDLAALASRQISGSLTRPVLGIGTYAVWAGTRLGALDLADAPDPPPPAKKIVPTREVPETDPPSVGAEVDFHDALERAQTDEWYAGYLHEVLAARTSGARRKDLLARAEKGRSRAGRLGRIAQDAGAEQVLRRAVYPLPDGRIARGQEKKLPLELARTLLEDHVVLAAAAPFEDRPLPIATALGQAVLLGRAGADLAPLPTLDPTD